MQTRAATRLLVKTTRRLAFQNCHGPLPYFWRSRSRWRGIGHRQAAIKTIMGRPTVCVVSRVAGLSAALSARGLSGPWLRILDANAPDPAALATAEVLVGEPALCGPLVDQCTKLVWLQSTFAGCNQVSFFQASLRPCSKVAKTDCALMQRPAVAHSVGAPRLHCHAAGGLLWARYGRVRDATHSLARTRIRRSARGPAAACMARDKGCELSWQPLPSTADAYAGCPGAW